METSFTGAHLLHLAAAGCVLNDVFREAERLGVIVYGLRVTASGGFNTETWKSTGIGHSVVDVRHLDTLRHRPFLARADRTIRPLSVAVLGRERQEPGEATVLDAICCRDCARSSTDRASDYGSEG